MKRTMIALLLVGFASVVSGSETPSGVAGEVWTADVAFDQAAAEGDLERFASLLADEAVFLGGGLLEGREAILQAWGPLFAENRTAVLRWQPHTVEVSTSGDLGYTIGDFQMTATLPDGSEVETGGTYVSIWQKGDDGRWRVVVDAGTPPE
jgi:uncharacterized protein (TIGR02246 family)